MALMTITINDPSPELEHRASKVAFAQRAVQLALTELAHGGGNIATGSIISQGADGTPNTSLGMWTYDVTGS
jgi:hypothetical protein